MATISAGFDPGTRWALLRIEGPAAESFLQRMLSNAVEGLGDDEARGAFLLEATGRIVSGGVFFRAPEDGFWAVCAVGWAERLADGLARYRVADPVEFHVDDRPVRLWIDPPSARLPAAPYGVVRADDGIGVRWPWTGGPEVLWIGEPDEPPSESDAALVEAARIAAGTPRFDAELTAQTIPLDAELTAWLDHRKGCYVGQEVIERMWSRDRRARRLTAFVFEGDAGAEVLPALPAALRGEGVKGSLTSAAEHPVLGTIGLGYLAGKGAPAAVEDDTGDRWRPAPPPLTTAS